MSGLGLLLPHYGKVLCNGLIVLVIFTVAATIMPESVFTYAAHSQPSISSHTFAFH